MTPSADAFAALSRSSPWRWTTLRFTLRSQPEDPRDRSVRAWLRRPDVVRVENLHGVLRQIVRERPDGRPDEPVLRPDGLVARRPSRDDAFDAPMYQNYFWVALLDPVELAEGFDEDTGAECPGTVIEDVREVEHGGRPAWEAVVRTTTAYEPRCGCCALLPSRDGDVVGFGPPVPLGEYPEAFRVRLDVGTGVCVLTEALDVPVRYGHEVEIEAVDEPMDDALFAQ